MPTTVVTDLLAKATISHDENGWHATRAFHVSGFNHPDATGRPYLATLAAGVPRRGDTHPVIPDLQVSSITTQTIDTEQYEVVCNYGLLTANQLPIDDFAIPQIEVSTTLQTRQRALAYDGAGNKVVMKVSYTFLPASGVGPPGPNDIVKQFAVVEVQVPMTIVRYRRRETTSPGDKSKFYVGKINATPVFNDGVGMWLCTELDGASTDGGASYNVSYGFQRNPDTWAAAPVFDFDKAGRDANNGDPSIGNGIELYRVYEFADFHGLNI